MALVRDDPVDEAEVEQDVRDFFFETSAAISGF